MQGYQMICFSKNVETAKVVINLKQKVNAVNFGDKVAKMMKET